MRWIAAFVVYVGLARGQGMCIPAAIHSSEVAGTVYFRSQSRPLSGVTVEIARDAYEAPIIASGRTGEDGRFSIPGIKKGKYRLSANHPVLGRFSVEFHRKSSQFKHAKTNIVIVIGDNPSKGPCWGGYATTTPKHQ